MRKAIVVEDFKLIADIWKSILIEEGFDTIEIFNHSEGLEKEILDFDPEIVLMDINIPGPFNGLDITEKLQKINDQLKVLILTIHTEPTFVQRAKDIGARGYVTKNSSIKELKKAINEVINGKFYLCEEINV